VIKARQTTLRLSVEEAQQLRFYQQECARCWNAILEEEKLFREQNAGAWIGKNDLQKRLKGRFRLHSQSVQALTDKFVANRDTIAQLRRAGNTQARFPWREKKFLTIPFKQMAIRQSSTGSLQLTLEARVSLDTGFIPSAPVHTAEILWRKGRCVLSYTAEFPQESPVEGGLRAGVDIGEIHPVALCAEDGTGLVVSGREVRSIKRRRNKSLGQLARALARCQKGSRRWKKLRRARGRMKSKSDRQVRDLLHQATRKAINWCQKQGVCDLVIGNPAGVEKNTRQKKRLSRAARQKVSQMETGRIKHYLQYKAQEAGILSCLVKEHGTSRDCPVCGSKNRVKTRAFQCSACGFTAHRDGKAGFLMIRKKHPDLPLPNRFRFDHQQSAPKYRKRPSASPNPACVDGPDVALSSLARAGSLSSESIAA
jgi:putative transposase